MKKPLNTLGLVGMYTKYKIKNCDEANDIQQEKATDTVRIYTTGIFMSRPITHGISLGL
jgi:hypothetical protein